MADRSHTARNVHVDEALSTKQLKLDVAKLKRQVAGIGTNTASTLTGVPQAATPYAVANRISDDGKVYQTVGFTSIPSLGRRFWTTHRLVRRDGTYGEVVRRGHKITAAMIASNSAEIEIDKGWRAHRTVHLVHVEVKLSDSPDNDGGSYDEEPDPYVEYDSPTSPGAPPPLATFTTGNAADHLPGHNLALNTKLNWGQTDWGDTAGTGTHNNTRLARWRYGAIGVRGWDVNQSIPDQTVTTTTNYWSSAAHAHAASLTTIPAGCLVIQSEADNLDVCVKLHHDPLDAEEPCIVEFSIYRPLLRGGGAIATSVLVEIEDGGTNQLLCSATINLTSLGLANNAWERVRTELMEVIAGYTGAAGAGQVARLKFSPSHVNSYTLIDKVMVSHMTGGYSVNPRDRQVTADQPTVRRTGSGRGAQGYGRTGAEPGTGGGRVRQSTE